MKAKLKSALTLYDSIRVEVSKSKARLSNLVSSDIYAEIC